MVMIRVSIRFSEDIDNYLIQCYNNVIIIFLMSDMPFTFIVYYSEGLMKNTKR